MPKEKQNHKYNFSFKEGMHKCHHMAHASSTTGSEKVLSWNPQLTLTAHEGPHEGPLFCKPNTMSLSLNQYSPEKTEHTRSYRDICKRRFIIGIGLHDYGY